MATIQEKEEKTIVVEEKAEVYTTDDVEQGYETTDDGFVPPDEKEWLKLRWKLDLRIIPYVGLLYLCSFLDRVNIGKRVYTSDNDSAVAHETTRSISKAMPKSPDYKRTWR